MNRDLRADSREVRDGDRRDAAYRVVYTLDEGARTVTVLAIAHRADVYRRR